MVLFWKSVLLTRLHADATMWPKKKRQCSMILFSYHHIYHDVVLTLYHPSLILILYKQIKPRKIKYIHSHWLLTNYKSVKPSINLSWWKPKKKDKFQLRQFMLCSSKNSKILFAGFKADKRINHLSWAKCFRWVTVLQQIRGEPPEASQKSL